MSNPKHIEGQPESHADSGWPFSVFNFHMECNMNAQLSTYQASKDSITISIGDTITSRGGSTYTVTAIRTEGRGKGLTITRASSGKEVRISDRMVQNTLSRINKGEEIKFQKNQTQGGISFTVAIEAGVIGCLYNLVEIDTVSRVYRRAS